MHNADPNVPPDFPGTDYSIAGFETCPQTGRKHWQCYIHYPNAKSFKSIKTAFATAHIEKARGTPQENKNYCAKEGGPVHETGVLPRPGSRSDIAAFAATIQSGATDAAILEEHVSCFVRYGRAIGRIRNAACPSTLTYNETLRVLCWWGPSGSGKTRAALAYAADSLVYEPLSLKPMWFDGYNPSAHSVLLLDDFRGDNLSLSVFLRLIDKYRRQWPVKGGSVTSNWNTILITADTHPNMWYPSPDRNVTLQVTRRINEVTHLTP